MTVKTNYHRVDATISAAERIRNSQDGNPTWRLLTDVGVFVTETNASLGYGIENYTNTRLADTFCIGDNAPAVTLLTTRAGRVCYIEKNGELLH